MTKHLQGRPVFVVSQWWPSYYKCGVATAAEQHSCALETLGLKVVRIGSQPIELPGYKNYEHITASGLSAFYSKPKVDTEKIKEVLKLHKPLAIYIEGWQLALHERFIVIAKEFGVPVILISHGVTLHAISMRPLDIIRSLAWLKYRLVTLPLLLKKISVLVVLSKTSTSDRFYDRKLAVKYGRSVLGIRNTTTFSVKAPPSNSRKRVGVLANFSRVKNQMGIIDLFADPRLSHLDLWLYGGGDKRYRIRCEEFAARLSLKNIYFIDPNNYSPEAFLAQVDLVLSLSITECLPYSLIEAMAVGRIFVATNVGASAELLGGVCVENVQQAKAEILRLTSDAKTSSDLSRVGLRQIEDEFRERHVVQSILETIEFWSKLPRPLLEKALTPSSVGP